MNCDESSEVVWPKACGCGCSYTPSQWQGLSLIGQMIDEVETIDLRNCPCGSTIAQTVKVSQ